jgi:hypothetical protein
MSKKYKSKVIQINVFPMSETSPIFGDLVTEVALDDEGGGEIIKLTQLNDEGDQVLKFEEIDELLAIVDVVKQLLEKPKNGVHNDNDRL